MNWALSIERETIADVTLVEEAERALEAGEVRLAVRRFALTANNITYAAFGTVMRYWDFFPGLMGAGACRYGASPKWSKARQTGYSKASACMDIFPQEAN